MTKPKKRPWPPAPPRRSARLYVELEPSKVAMFRFLLEAWDNLALFTVANRKKATLMLRFAPGQRAEVLEFLDRAHDLTGARQVFDPQS